MTLHPSNITPPNDLRSSKSPPADQSRRCARDLLTERFGGRQSDVAAAAHRTQSTVSKWDKRGVPLEAALDICANAPSFGVEITFDEVREWIQADRNYADRAGRK
jgi:hypothetical protein